jgi:prolyl-tRNA synthetase
LNVIVDARDERSGEKVWHWIKKGVPLRIEIGPRDIEKDALFVGRRDRTPKDKQTIAREEFIRTAPALLQSIHDELHARALAHRRANERRIDTKAEFYEFFTSEREEPNKPTPIHGGFALTHFSGEPALEQQIKDELSVTVRCIPFGDDEPGVCPFTDKPSAKRVVWAKSY